MYHHIPLHAPPHRRQPPPLSAPGEHPRGRRLPDASCCCQGRLRRPRGLGHQRGVGALLKADAFEWPEQYREFFKRLRVEQKVSNKAFAMS